MPTKPITTGITRYDIPEKKTFGCMMRICRQGKRYNEFFSDADCGGKRKSKDAAIARYNELAAQLPEPGPVKNKATVRNSSGVVGVHNAETLDASGNVYLAYCASWVDETGRRCKINFSVSKYGDRKAWALACFARKHKISDRQEVETRFKASAGSRAPRRKK